MFAQCAWKLSGHNVSRGDQRDIAQDKDKGKESECVGGEQYAEGRAAER